MVRDGDECAERQLGREIPPRAFDAGRPQALSFDHVAVRDSERATAGPRPTDAIVRQRHAQHGSDVRVTFHLSRQRHPESPPGSGPADEGVIGDPSHQDVQALDRGERLHRASAVERRSEIGITKPGGRNTGLERLGDDEGGQKLRRNI
ncbi:hypothetical protein [Microbacterium sp. SS28]|uniref:hypothetical protein n=1 Tax=Microbacterium sp. SS28 TaxID=2919948 RepID=UPI001FA99FD3|nr:hypothetical protein [Microbacterium sp. SS28]